MLLTKEITEQEILGNIDGGKYLNESFKPYTKQLGFSAETFDLFKVDVLLFLSHKFGFTPKQSDVIFNRCWADCSIGGLKSVLDEAIDLALFTKELYEVA